MKEATDTLRRSDRAVPGLLAGGVVFTVLGVLAIVLPGIASVTIDVLVGWLLMSAGLVGLTITRGLDGVPSWRGIGWVSGLTFAAGLLLVLYPFAGAETVTLPLVALFTVEGTAMVVFGLRVRRHLPGGSWLVLNGVGSIVVAALIIIGWPETVRWAIGMLVGVNLLTTGVALAMLGMSLHGARDG